jgi:hypothetical protein
MKDIKGNEIETGDEIAYASYSCAPKLSVGTVTSIGADCVQVMRSHSSAYGFGKKFVYDEKTKKGKFVDVQPCYVWIGIPSRVVILKKHATW